MSWEAKTIDPQIEKALLKADCGAERATWPSGHKVWRVREDNVGKLPPVPASIDRSPKSGAVGGIVVKDEDGRDQYIASLIYSPYAGEKWVSEWRPIAARRVK